MQVLGFLLKWFIKIGPTRVMLKLIIVGLTSLFGRAYFRRRDRRDGYVTEKRRVIVWRQVPT